MQTIVFGMLLRNSMVTLPRLLLLILMVLVIIASPLAIIVASRWEELQGLRYWKRQNALQAKNAPAF